MLTMVLAGALVGVGLVLVLAGLRTTAPDLRIAISRLEATYRAPARGSLTAGAGVPGVGVPGRGMAPIAARLSRALDLDRHRADLLITGTTPEQMAAQKVAYALVGLVFPALLTAILGIAGLSVPVLLPAAAGLGLGLAMSFLPEVELRRRAARAREQMRRTVCAYLELVALERAADAGAVEALERAASIGHDAGFLHVREALLRARLEGRTPWTQLAALAADVDVAELGDVADIMRLSGEDGAAVLATLRARAASLRTSLLQAEVAAANEASERMSIPVALLGVAFMALLGFPALWRIVLG